MIDIETFIPSQTYKGFLRENQLELNACQKAKLIYISHKSFEDKWVGYRNLIATERTAPILWKMLEYIVDYEERFVKEELKEKTEMVHLLEVCNPENDFQWEEIGIYASARRSDRAE